MGLGRQPGGAASTGPVISFLPIILIAVLFGLAMDYEVNHGLQHPRGLVVSGAPTKLAKTET